MKNRAPSQNPMKNEPPLEPHPEADDTKGPVPDAEETDSGWPREEEPQEEEFQEEGNPPASSDSKWMRWEVVMVGVLVLLVFLGGVIFYIKLDDIRESNADTASALRDFTMLDERAWVEPAGIVAPLAVESPMSISTKAVNRGKTPANSCVLMLYIQYFKYPALPDMSALESGSNARFPDQLAVAPGQQVTFSTVATPEALSSVLFDGIQSGEIRLFILGEMRYRDIFKKRHWAKFCYVFDPKTSQWIDFGNTSTDNQ
jgi:hypothetical protein